MRFVVRTLQRVAILGLGVLSVWLIAFVFRWVDSSLSWILALSVTYGLAAYVILPRAVRMGLKILQRRHVPRYTVTGDGLPGDPVNLALVGTLGQLHAAFATAGWAGADPLSLASSWRSSGTGSNAKAPVCCSRRTTTWLHRGSGAAPWNLVPRQQHSELVRSGPGSWALSRLYFRHITRFEFVAEEARE